MLMPSPDEMKKQPEYEAVDAHHRFADVVSRYAIILKNSHGCAQRRFSSRGGSLTPSQLARIMLRSNYSITKLIDGLEKDGLVMRRPDGRDRRSINVEVTSEGLNYVTSSLSKTVIAERELKSWLNKDELESLAPAIRKLRDRLIEKISKRHGLSVDDRKAIFDKARAGVPENKL
jgi:DNA-binding MarR family transcriptional regulator